MSERDTTTTLAFDKETIRKYSLSATHIEIYHQGSELSFDKDVLPVYLGRDDAVCQIVVTSALASRKHCAIAMKDGQIGLLDESTNGTFIQIGRGGSFLIKGAFYPLTGQGKLKLGSAFNNDDEKERIYFRMVTKNNVS